MSEKEFKEWKTNNPKTYRDVYHETMKSWIREFYKHSMSEVAFTSPNANKDEQEYTYGRIAQALINENDCCDNLVRMEYQGMLYRNTLNK